GRATAGRAAAWARAGAAFGRAGAVRVARLLRLARARRRRCVEPGPRRPGAEARQAIAEGVVGADDDAAVRRRADGRSGGGRGADPRRPRRRDLRAVLLVRPAAVRAGRA